jgi:hypothetical protein
LGVNDLIDALMREIEHYACGLSRIARAASGILQESSTHVTSRAGIGKTLQLLPGGGIGSDHA